MCVLRTHLKNIHVRAAHSSHIIKGAQKRATHMRTSKTKALTTTGSQALALKGGSLCLVAVYGTYTGVSLTIEGTVDGSNWFPVNALKRDSGLIQNGVTVLASNASVSYTVGAGALAQVRARVTAISTGTVNLILVNDDGLAPNKEETNYCPLSMNVARSTAGVAAGSGAADVAVCTGTGILHRLCVTTAGTAAISLYDHPSVSSGAPLLFTSAATYALGTLTELNIPFTNGLVAVQANGSAAVTVFYSLL